MRGLHKLTVRTVESTKEKGRYSDGGNLYLVVTAAGTRQWVFRYRWNDGEKEMGLGSAAPGRVALATARKLAQSARDALSERKDPMGVRNEAQQSLRSIRNFGKVAEEFLKAKCAGWRNPKHRAQWEYSLKTLAAPLHQKQVHLIENTDVLEVLRPLWQSVPETARRLRGRIESVLGFATLKKYRSGDNPARWKDNLKELLSRHDELTRGPWGFRSCWRFSFSGFMVTLMPTSICVFYRHERQKLLWTATGAQGSTQEPKARPTAESANAGAALVQVKELAIYASRITSAGSTL